jgi:hypothetical protein
MSKGALRLLDRPDEPFSDIEAPAPQSNSASPAKLELRPQGRSQAGAWERGKTGWFTTKNAKKAKSGQEAFFASFAGQNEVLKASDH